jgi:hypothetical protein
MQHLLQYAEVYQDGLFTDPLIATLAGLIGCRIDMFDAINSGFTCLFSGGGCTYGDRHLSDLREHMEKYSGSAKLYLKVLSMFWDPILHYYAQGGTWTIIGMIFEA